jgi:hypothetical protein
MEIKTNAKIRVRLESFNHELLVSSCQKDSKYFTKYSIKFNWSNYITNSKTYLLCFKITSCR